MVKIGKVISPEKLSEDCAMCSLSPLMGELAHNKRVEIQTNARVMGMRGKAGDFTLELESGPFKVSLEKCRACGRCEDVCQATAKDEWNAGLGLRNAIYRPFPQSIPSAYTIDRRLARDAATASRSAPPMPSTWSARRAPRR